MDEQHLRRNIQVILDTAINDFNSGEFKTQMKKMATQVNFYLYPYRLLKANI